MIRVVLKFRLAFPYTHTFERNNLKCNGNEASLIKAKHQTLSDAGLSSGLECIKKTVIVSEGR